MALINSTCLGATIEDRLHIGSLHAGFVVIQQSIIGMLCRREEGNVFMNQFQHFLQVRAKNGKVRFAPASTQASKALDETIARSAINSGGTRLALS